MVMPLWQQPTYKRWEEKQEIENLEETVKKASAATKGGRHYSHPAYLVAKVPRPPVPKGYRVQFIGAARERLGITGRCFVGAGIAQSCP